MSLRLQVKKLMLQRSPRVKAMDFHPTNPWVVFGLYSGTLSLYDYSNNTCIRTLQASTFPIRAIRFIPQKNWIVCGSDDFQLRVFNYNTMEKVKSIEAHVDFIRAIIVHPSEPFIITASDDSKIKIWNHDKDFILVRTLDEHKHFVMALAFNPKDLTKFGSTSMDKTVKIWNLTTQGKANFTLTGHKGSVNCIDFYKGDKPHLATGSDDHSIRVWDYQTRQCLHTIQYYKLAVTSVCFHPQLPLLISTAEDGQSMIFHSSSYGIMNTLQYNLGMGWSCAVGVENTNVLGIGFDEGSVVLKIGSDDPVVDIHNGKVLYAKNMQIYNVNLKAISYEQDNSNPPSPTVSRVFSSPKQLGSTDLYPTTLSYSPNGHHFGISNTKQFAVIKLASFKTVVLGNGSQLTWFGDSEFVVVQNDTIHQYRSLQYTGSIKIPIIVEKMFGGKLLTIVGKQTTLIYDWNNLSKPLHKLQQSTERTLWSKNESQLALITKDKSTVFSYNPKSHSLTQTLTLCDRLTSCRFVQQIFYYMTRSGKIYFSFYGHEFFYSMVDDKRQFILGQVSQQSRLYLMDRNMNVYGVYIPFSVLQQVAEFVVGKRRQEPQVPEQFRNLVAKCYHVFGLVKQAYKITQSTQHKFQLALALGYTRDAYKLAINHNMSQKIKVIGDLSLKKGEIELAIDCYERISDLSTLLMIYSSLQLKDKLLKLGQKAQKMTRMNIAYMCFYLTGQRQKCLSVLIKSRRFSEAALFARTYCVQRVSDCVNLWKQSLSDKSIADKISDLVIDAEENQDEQQEQQGDENGSQGQQGTLV